MYVREILADNEVQPRKKKFREIYFITHGQVDMYDATNNKFMYLPTGCIFGDYQVLYRLESNISFKVAHNSDGAAAKFMASDRKVVELLCELYPHTA